MEVETLGKVHSHMTQSGRLCRGLDALGHHARTQTTAEREDAVDHGLLVRIALESVDQAQVDLEQIHDSGGAKIEAIDPAAEIVEGDQDTGSAQSAGMGDQRSLLVASAVFDQLQAE